MIINPYRYASDAGFQFTWKTDNAGVSTSTQATIPTYSANTYDCHVDWGDGNDDDITTHNDAAWTHTYAGAGTYTITITGTFGRIYFANGGDKLKILNILSFGNVGWETMGSAFYGCANLTIDADAKTGLELVEDFTYAWRGCSGMTSFPLVDVSAGTNYYGTWYGDTGLPSFPALDVSSGENFTNTWYNCSGFETMPALDFSSGTTFNGTLRGCTSLTTLASGFGSTMGAGTSFINFLYGVTLDTADYNNFWTDIEPVNSNNLVTFHGGNSQHSGAGTTARAAMAADHSWSIADGGAA